MSIVLVSDTDSSRYCPLALYEDEIPLFLIHETVPSITLLTNILLSSPRVVINLIENHMTAAYLTAMLKDLGVSYTGSDARVFLLTSTPQKVCMALRMEGIAATEERGKDLYSLIIIGNCTKNRVIFEEAPRLFFLREAMEECARRVFSLLEMKGYAYMTFTVHNDTPSLVEVSPALPKVYKVLQGRFDCNIKQITADIVEGAYRDGRSLE